MSDTGYQIFANFLRSQKLAVQQLRVKTRWCMFAPLGDAINHAGWRVYCCRLDCFICSLNVPTAPSPHFQQTDERRTNKMHKIHILMHMRRCRPKGSVETVSRSGPNIYNEFQISFSYMRGQKATQSVNSQWWHSPKKNKPGNGRKAPCKSFNWAFLPTNTSLLPEGPVGNTRQWLFCSLGALPSTDINAPWCRKWDQPVAPFPWPTDLFYLCST